MIIYAVEEFGKAISLKEAIDGHQTTYDMPKWIFDDHDTKLIKGFEKLPDECGEISRGIKISSNFSKGTKTIKIDAERMVSIPTMATGRFFDTTSPTSFKKNLVLKGACFYIDWDNRNGVWRYDVVTDTDLLREKIALFREALDQFRCH